MTPAPLCRLLFLRADMIMSEDESVDSLYPSCHKTLWIAAKDGSLEITYLSGGGWLFLLSIEEG